MTASLESLSRRDLLKAGGGLVVAIAYAPISVLAHDLVAPAHLPGSLEGNRELSAWLRVNPHGTVTVFTGKAELGQGIGSALAQAAADELDVDYGRIDMVTADTSRTPDEGFTAGSQSIEQSGIAIRFACAEARQILLAAAAARLGIEAGDLTVADGTIVGPGGKQNHQRQQPVEPHRLQCVRGLRLHRRAGCDAVTRQTRLGDGRASRREG